MFIILQHSWSFNIVLKRVMLLFEKTHSDAADKGCMRKILWAVVRPYYPRGLFLYFSDILDQYSGNYASIMDSSLTSIQPPNLKHGWLFLNLKFVFTYSLATAGYLWHQLTSQVQHGVLGAEQHSNHNGHPNQSCHDNHHHYHSNCNSPLGAHCDELMCDNRATRWVRSWSSSTSQQNLQPRVFVAEMVISDVWGIYSKVELKFNYPQ